MEGLKLCAGRRLSQILQPDLYNKRKGVKDAKKDGKLFGADTEADDRGAQQRFPIAPCAKPVFVCFASIGLPTTLLRSSDARVGLCHCVGL
jgi:hypothetical protein